jgi:soluble lytic murein transglycosylase-like protein
MFCFTPSEALKYPILIAVACVASFSFAAESGAGASSEYRLSIEKSAAFRAAATEPAIPALDPRKETAIAARFADRPFAKLIDVAARDAALDPALVHAVISIESGYNHTARSPKGALGLMQVMPATAARYGVRDPGRSPAANLKAGTLYLSDLMQLFDSRIDLVLAAYNAGENAVLRYGQRIPPYRETQQYVPAVLARYREWREEPLLPVVVPAPIRIEYLPGTGLDLDYLRGAGYR